MEKPVRFTDGKDTMYGILHRPENNACLPVRMGMAFINAGLRPRSGLSCQYVRFARKLCQMGFYVLRFDLPGIGDSEGHIEEASELRPLVAENINSTMHAIDFFKTETGIQRVGLLGHCGGAYNALVSGALDPRVNDVVLLSLPAERFEDLSEKPIPSSLLHQYLKKALQWQSWINLISLRSKFDVMAAVLVRLVKRQRKCELVDEFLWKAFETCIANDKSVLFAFGENDPFYPAFAAGFGRRLLNLKEHEKTRTEVYVIEKADHVLSQRYWQELAIDKAIAWIQNRCRMAVRNTPDRLIEQTEG
jgi:pimeloyl-ACP methyl ester carboxylesterase